MKTKLYFQNHKLLFSLLVILLMILFSFIYALFNTYQLISQLKKFELNQAQTTFNQTQPLVKIFNLLTLKQNSDLFIWEQSFKILEQSFDLNQNLLSYFSLATSDNPETKIYLDRIKNNFRQIADLVTQTEQKSQTSILFKKYTPKIETYLSMINDLNQVIEYFTSQDKQVIVLFQNSDELRATGGFMGSYALVNLKQGVIGKIDVQDIYQPDGQFTGFVEAPTGVKEYLSSGKGLRLPDANWEPDFPTSSKQILNFFALGQEQKIDSLVAINLSVAQDLLQITGPIYLPDYQQTITADNLAQIARSDRDSFFPGSQQKPNFLSSLVKFFQYKVNYLSNAQKKELIFSLIKNFKNQNIQIFSNDENIQKIWSKYLVSGELKSTGETIFLVESNVGINKANQNISRAVSIEINDYLTQIEINFNNKNSPDASTPDDHLGYVNYQRLIVNNQDQIKQISYQGQNIEHWDERKITNSSAESFKEIGFLITLPEQQTATLSIQLSHPALKTPLTLSILKQSGLPPTPYQINYHDQKKELLLERNETITFD